MNETFEEADTIDVLDEEDFEEAQTSHQDIPRNIPQKEENKDSAKENKHKRKSSDFSLTGVSKRKRSASDDAGTAYKPKIKVAGPWNRHDSITNDNSEGNKFIYFISHRLMSGDLLTRSNMRCGSAR